ncbi:hypothetical protein C0Q70_04243 [Pomacea canaliculata]|uniref:B30.2/SPRY domain-containing protein n=2 Tax=Pomacea canaliculata TaxID=400727 RepID=A0A2T7PV44_POMCA|nr:SPRY domain-containing SOCS box protein 1-like isoform X2 [Pomacea canaliculata]PVD37247.1 hypothetical protein C0Q70_04243 [Pomacea canaliculata]
MREVVPAWVYTVVVPPEYASDHVSACAEGMTVVGPNSVQRVNQSSLETDAFRWSRGFTSGKHTFEIHFPKELRGQCASVGVGLDSAALHSKGRVALVGNNKSSWGLDLCARRTFHAGAMVKKYPQTQEFLPDKFYMYVDADALQVQFGSDGQYYGTAINGLPPGKPLYPMVSASYPGAVITMYYRGQANVVIVTPVPQQPVVMAVPVFVPQPQPLPPPYTAGGPAVSAQPPPASEAPPIEKKEQAI